MSTLNEFLLYARFKGALPANEDDRYWKHLVLEIRAMHALGDDEEMRAAVGYLTDLEVEPDDEMVHSLLGKWREQLFGARTISLGGRGRRPDDEMDYIRFQLYLLVAKERPVSVRGAFYRAESAGLIPKNESGYRTVQRQILKMRRDGLLPWSWITDHSRKVWGRKRFKTLKEYAEHVAANYYADYWAEAPFNVEVWCEKDAMYGVISPRGRGEIRPKPLRQQGPILGYLSL